MSGHALWGHLTLSLAEKLCAAGQILGSSIRAQSHELEMAKLRKVRVEPP